MGELLVLVVPAQKKCTLSLTLSPFLVLALASSPIAIHGFQLRVLPINLVNPEEENSLD
jgi:hypothetical protein